ncbi:protein FAR1-RELATED SEQUENCE 5-like [Bidens hawaiensis]|uniref:protein FAR1-RELATED SEQUENCE 5-like n=1 Tax=Bidens hawaiensis TaxID=980011 RepID=UPI004049BC88
MSLYDILFGDGNDDQSGYAYNDQPEQSGFLDLNEVPHSNHEPGRAYIEKYDFPNLDQGHPALRKRTDEEVDMVATLHRQGLGPTQIKAALKKQFSGNKCINKDIYNIVKHVDGQDKIGDTPMQVLEIFLVSHGFTFHTLENPSTKRTENIFFGHEKSHTMWRAFPNLLLIDTTYNTNMYKWPFVQFVGVTSTSKSFCIAHAVIFKEQ